MNDISKAATAPPALDLPPAAPQVAHPRTLSPRTRWVALGVVCLGVLMAVLDITIVNVALPSIRADLGFSEATLVWVVNGYMLTCGGFLLLGGRLGDLYGQRRLFVIGVAIFTLASLACGIASSQVTLVVARAIQGVGGAIVEAVALALLMNLFTEPAERAKAMGVYGFVCAGGGSIGVLLGGTLTDLYSWHWIFLVNLPIGIGVIALSLALLPTARSTNERPRLDVFGAITVTAALMLAVFAIVGGTEIGWTAPRTLAGLGAAAVLLGVFVAIEARVAQPLMPLRLLRSRAIAASNVIAVLWSAAMFACFFLSALYLQRVLGYSASQVGLAFLPTNLVMAVCSLGLSARVVMRFGIRGPMVAGLLAQAVGLLLFARAPVGGSFVVDVLPGMLLLGLGAGIAFNPLLLAAMGDVPESESGLASGIVNTSFMMGGALGLAVLASLAAAHSGAAGTAAGSADRATLNAGYQLAFAIGAGFAFAAAALGAWAFRGTVARRAGAAPH
ncbi:DHA2 family efflux MFS transporter permease subunit [Piscinibacter koreensis]|uniref:DHA2 family efflux MFS transporter permease subunit n=1 Tax=Piscinibacter koreensis TaxID=2742824 RepID=A0A7Y6TV82_9BURK|nr:DHA2 family efflux MFS transporter permease subunit [Schlegelella koreensis]NUZ04775.1 DHA2 family efflux MFS transporter permease subunit [Schlegelella koreensis]